MANHPPAEIPVDADLVRQLLREQHPSLADQPLQSVANGWDNYIFRLGTDYAVRLPRRLAAAQLAANEQEWLPALTADLSVGTSSPLFAGAPSDAFPWPWNITRWFSGSEVSLLPRDRNIELAAPLAGFVNAFHQPAPAGYPRNPVRGVPLASRDDAVRSRLDSGMVPHAARVRELWEASVDLPPWPGPPLWLHGDLHPANLVGGADGGLEAVIDFGDLTAGIRQPISPPHGSCSTRPDAAASADRWGTSTTPIHTFGGGRRAGRSAWPRPCWRTRMIIRACT
ncbi:phosphotransferase [Arthrobacter citreus]|uniref:phosphotransferase n=1 Tax=Arthrobacter citreus TaxID=1670 RepID=UPI0031F89C96